MAKQRDELTETKEKPKCKLIGKDSNIFNLLGIASQTLERAKQYESAKKMLDRAVQCKSYDEALVVIQDYVDVV
jgi:hypothetical protein